MKFYLLFLLVCLFCIPFYTYAQNASPYPSGISYQGKVLKDGQLYEGNESILFELINQDDEVKWSETQQVLIQRGLYSVLLGSITPIPDNFFSENSSLRLRIKIGNTAPMIVSSLNTVPYAHMARGVAPNSITPSNIVTGGNNKILTTNSTGEVVWLNKTDFQANPTALGSAGGDLNGYYNNLQINAAAITKDELATSAVETDKIKNAAVTPLKIQAGVNNDMVMITNGSGAVVWEDRSTFNSSALALGTSSDISGDATDLQIKPNSVTEIEILNGAVTTDKIANGNVTDAKLANNAVTTDKIANGNVTLEKIAAVGNDKVMTVDNAGVVAWEDRANFTTTLSLGTSSDISGDATDLQIKPNSVTEIEILNGAVTTDKIANGNVTLEKIAAVGNDKVMTVDNAGVVAWENRTNFATTLSLGTSSDISGDATDLQIKPNSVTEIEILNGAVTTDKIANGSVTDAKLANNAVTTDKIANGNVTLEKIAAVGNDKVMTVDNAGVVAWENRANFTTTLSLGTSSDISGDATDLQIKPNSVTEIEILNGAVTTDKIANGNVTLEKIAAVGNDRVMTVDNAGVVAWEDRANFTTTLSLGASSDISGDATDLQIKPNSVTEIEIINGAVTTDKIANGNVTNAKLANNAVTTDKIANGNVTLEKIAAVGNDKVMTVDNAGVVAWENRANFAITLSLGTSSDISGDATDLQIKPNSVTEIEILNGAVTTDKIANGNVTLEKIAAVGNDRVMTVDNAGVVAWEDRANFTTTLSLGASSDISGDATDLQIKAGKVTSTELANNAVTNAKIVNGSITPSKMAIPAPTTPIARDQVLIASNTGAMGWVTSENLIGHVEIMDGGIFTQDLANGAVTDVKITSMKPSKLQQEGASIGEVLKWNGSEWAPASDETSGGGTTSYYSIDPSDFQMNSLSDGSSGPGDKNNLVVFSGSNPAATVRKKADGETISAPFHLPHNATVQSITVYYMDDRPGSNNIDFYIDRNSYGSGTSIISSAVSNESNNSVSSRNLSGTPFSIDNQNYTYTFRVEFKVGGSDVEQYADMEQGIYGVKIQYTTP